MTQDYEDDYDGEEADEEWEFDCGMEYNGRGQVVGCSMAGSEDCDFECPNRNEMYRILERRAKLAQAK